MGHTIEKLWENHISLISVASLQDFTESMKLFSVSLPCWDGRTSMKSVLLVFSCHILMVNAGRMNCDLVE